MFSVNAICALADEMNLGVPIGTPLQCMALKARDGRREGWLCDKNSRKAF
jgi:hypothetical protein